MSHRSLLAFMLLALPITVACGDKGGDEDEGDDAPVDLDGDGFEAFDDCNDDDATIYPGAEDTWYDGIDSDCAGDNDFDQDADGHDSIDYDGDDCDDTDATINPSASDTWYDGIDSDCAGDSDYDQDADGYDSVDYGGEDCDDLEATTYPDAEDAWYDGVDSNCWGDSDFDADVDGYDSLEYGGDDCDDDEPTTYPGADDTWYDGVDSDCAENSDYDQDGDGHDSTDFGGEDCEDELLEIGPEVDEVCDDIDNNCDGDIDGDDAIDGPCVEVLEDFESGVWPATDWTQVDAADDDGAVDSFAYEGSYSVLNPNWAYLSGPTLAVGDVLSAWIYFTDGGRVYLGFDSTSAGTRSFVAAPNTGDVRFQDNTDWDFDSLTELEYAVPEGEWLRMELSIDSATETTGSLYAQDGTLLVDLTETWTDAHGGGTVAIRSFNDAYIDYIELY